MHTHTYVCICIRTHHTNIPAQSAPSKLFLDASIIIKVADYILLAILVVVAVVVVMTMIAVVLVTIVLMLALIHGRYEPGNVCCCYALEISPLLCSMTEYRNHNGQEVSCV